MKVSDSNTLMRPSQRNYPAHKQPKRDWPNTAKRAESYLAP